MSPKWGISLEVLIRMYAFISHPGIIMLREAPTDQGFDKGPTPNVVGIHLSLFVGFISTV